MSIISISRFSDSASETIAREVAARLGHAFLDQEVFEQAATDSGMPLEKIDKAFNEAPSLFGMSLATRKRAVTAVQAALASRFLVGDVVYLGHYGHLLIHGVSHLLKVRITALEEDRVASMVERDACTATEAEKRIRKADKQRAALTKQLFCVTGDDADLFDLAINTSQVDEATAVDIITETARHKRYQPMTYSVRCMRNIELGHRVRASLLDLDADIDVQAEDGTVRIRLRDVGGDSGKRAAAIRQRATSIADVEHVEVKAIKDALDKTTRWGR